LAKVACGAFADNAFVSGRQRRDFAGLRSSLYFIVSPSLYFRRRSTPRQSTSALDPATVVGSASLVPRIRAVSRDGTSRQPDSHLSRRENISPRSQSRR
jgi:hypothetical protein